MFRLKWSLVLLLLATSTSLFGQDRLQSWPIWARYEKDRNEQSGLIKFGTVQTKFVDDTHMAYKKGENWYLVELPSGRETKVSAEPKEAAVTSGASANSRRRQPGRGGQFAESFSADGKVKAFYRDANVWVQKDGGVETPVTKDGSIAARIKYGIGSWVYGEELGQSEAMGVSPDGTKVWYYRFDESKVIDNMVVFKQATPQPVFEAQAYPKPGAPNPAVDLFIYDVAAGSSVPVKVRPGPFDDGVGHYVYDIQWSPSGHELFFRRTDRRQKTMEFCTANTGSGEVRVIVKEEWPQSFADNKLRVWFLDNLNGIDKRNDLRGKMLWESSRNGFINLYIVELATGKTQTVTQNQFDETAMVRVDLALGKIFYMGRGMDNPYLDQLYVVNLDGTGNRKVTDGKFDHSVRVSNDGKYVVDTAQTCQDPPFTNLIDINGKVVRELAKSDLSAFFAAGYGMPERVEFLAADGKTKVCGVVNKPRNWDKRLKYPLIVGVYGGPLDPHSSGFSENFRAYDPQTGFGILTASFDNRGTGGRGKVFSDPMYHHMGTVEMDDQAEGVKALIAKGYVDPDKVGIEGTSYGGYSSCMTILRHPDVYKAACASSAVTDWHNYDTIYTERYMDVVEQNQQGYDEGSAVKIADKLKGWLMLYYGTADENVHPCNTLQLLQALRRAGKGVEVQVGTDQGHSGVDSRRMMEFFFERLSISKG